ncbi:AraC family transcriptional regulator [Sinobacterium caligoides]|uniref:AraC family transcriptional regulator n=1 Tax=Sinobacterium caligoides TaxID=933926 RepID=A0A3N2DZR2_9GAMM|nr:AraC family transcriptional regulator [Sinobacterium caligoides]ROS05363.1 AraC family transcriptional regulator [Sinobacterium caligoides]
MHRQKLSSLPSLGTTSMPPVWQFLQAARHRNIVLSEALQNADITFPTLYEADARLDGERFQQLLAYLVEQVEAPLFGLYSARFVQPDRFYIIGQIGLNAVNLSQALREALPLERLVGDMGVTELREHPEGLKMVWRCQYSHPLVVPELIDNVLASWLNFARLLLDDTEGSPVEVRLQRPQPSRAACRQYREVFGCAVHFAQNEDALVIAREHLTRPLPSANQQRLAQLKASARLGLEHIGEEDQLSLQAARVMRQMMPQGKLRREQVAEQLGLGGRSLQRGLLREGASYQQLLDQVRREMADYWLTCSGLSMEEVALQLGFSDGRVFFRAYRQWAGQTPGATRSASRRRFRGRDGLSSSDQPTGR